MTAYTEDVVTRYKIEDAEFLVALNRMNRNVLDAAAKQEKAHAKEEAAFERLMNKKAKGWKEEVGAQQKVQKETRKTADATDKATKSNYKNFKSLKDVEAGLNLVARGVRLVAGAWVKAMQQGNAYKNMIQSQTLSINKARTVTKGLVDDFTLTQQANMAAAMGVTKSNEGFAEMARLATVVARKLGVDANDAISRVTRGIGKMEVELLDELGIRVRVNEAIDKHAARLGKLKGALSQSERQMALNIDVMEKMRDIAGETTIEVDSMGDQWTQVTNAFNNFWKGLAAFMASQTPGQFSGWLAQVALAGKELRDWLEWRQTRTGDWTTKRAAARKEIAAIKDRLRLSGAKLTKYTQGARLAGEKPIIGAEGAYSLSYSGPGWGRDAFGKAYTEKQARAAAVKMGQLEMLVKKLDKEYDEASAKKWGELEGPPAPEKAGPMTESEKRKRAAAARKAMRERYQKYLAGVQADAAAARRADKLAKYEQMYGYMAPGAEGVGVGLGPGRWVKGKKGREAISYDIAWRKKRTGKWGAAETASEKAWATEKRRFEEATAAAEKKRNAANVAALAAEDKRLGDIGLGGIGDLQEVMGGTESKAWQKARQDIMAAKDALSEFGMAGAAAMSGIESGLDILSSGFQGLTESFAKATFEALSSEKSMGEAMRESFGSFLKTWGQKMMLLSMENAASALMHLAAGDYPGAGYAAAAAAAYGVAATAAGLGAKALSTGTTQEKKKGRGTSRGLGGTSQKQGATQATFVYNINTITPPDPDDAATFIASTYNRAKSLGMV